MTKMKLWKVLEMCEGFRAVAGQNLVRYGELRPVAFVWGYENGKPAIVTMALAPGTLDFGPDVRDGWAEQLVELVRKHDGYAALLLNEAWMAAVPKGTPVSDAENLSASKMPGRFEAILAVLHHEELPGPKMWVGKFGRDAAGKPLAPASYDETPGREFSGRFMGIIERARAQGDA